MFDCLDFLPKVQWYSDFLIFFSIVQFCLPASSFFPIVQCWSRDVSAMMYCPSPGPSQTPETDTKRREREGAAILPPASYHHLHLCYLNMNCNKSLLCCVFLNCCNRIVDVDMVSMTHSDQTSFISKLFILFFNRNA